MPAAQDRVGKSPAANLSQATHVVRRGRVRGILLKVVLDLTHLREIIWDVSKTRASWHGVLCKYKEEGMRMLFGRHVGNSRNISDKACPVRIKAVTVLPGGNRVMCIGVS